MRCALLRAALSAACLMAVAAHKDSIRPRRKLADQAVPLTGAEAVPATGATPLVMEAKPAAALYLPDFSILFPLRPANLQTPTGTFAFQVTNAGAEAVCKGKGSYRVMVALDPESPKGTTISAPVAPKGYRAQVIRNSQAIVYTFEGASVPAESESDFSGTITMPTTGTARLVITADYQNKVQEANEENNSSTLDIATAGVNDLMALFGTAGEGHKAPREANMPTSIKVEVGKDGKTRPTPKQLTFTVTNDGPFNVAVAPGAYQVTLSLDPKTAPAKTGLVFHKQKGPKGYTVSGDAHKLTYTLQSGVIPPGDTEFAYSLMVGEAGSVELVVVADATGAVEEMVKKNNMAQTTFPVVPTTKTVKYRRTAAHVN